MGNATSTPTATGGEVPQRRPDASARRYHSQSMDRSADAPMWLSERTTSIDSFGFGRTTSEDLSADDNEEGNFGGMGRPSSKRPPPRSSPTSSRRRVRSFDGGILKGNIAAKERQDESKRGFVDPILKAAAVGAQARKAKPAHLRQQQEMKRRQELERQRQERIRAENEWKSSLQRLASAAASTAHSVAHATAPVWKDASAVVRESAKEFVHEVQNEWKKEDGQYFDNDEESVVLYPSSRHWLTTPTRSFDLSPSDTPNSRTSRAVRTTDGPSIPMFPHADQSSSPRPGVQSQLFPHQSSSSSTHSRTPRDETAHEKEDTRLEKQPAEETSAALDVKKIYEESTGEAVITMEEETSSELDKDQTSDDAVQDSAGTEGEEGAITDQAAADDNRSNESPQQSPEGVAETSQGADDPTLDEESVAATETTEVTLNNEGGGDATSNEAVETAKSIDDTDPEATRDTEERVLSREDKKKAAPWKSLLQTFKESRSDTSQSSDLISMEDPKEHVQDSPEATNASPSLEGDTGLPQPMDDERKSEDRVRESSNAHEVPGTQEDSSAGGASNENDIQGLDRHSASKGGESQSISNLERAIGTATSQSEEEEKAAENPSEAPVPGDNSSESIMDIDPAEATAPLQEKDNIAAVSEETTSTLENEKGFVFDGDAATTFRDTESQLFAGDEDVVDNGASMEGSDSAMYSINDKELTPIVPASSSLEEETIQAPTTVESEHTTGDKPSAPVTMGHDCTDDRVVGGRNGSVTRYPDVRGPGSKINGPLFEASEAAIYETSGRQEEEKKSSQTFGASSGHGFSISAPRSFLQLVIARASEASRPDPSRKRTSENSELEKPFRSRTDTISESVFDDEIAMELRAPSKSDSSSISSPEIPPVLSGTGSTQSTTEIDVGDAVFWDLYPPKQDVVPGNCAFTLSDGLDLEKQKQDTSFVASDTASGSISLIDHAASLGTPKNAFADSFSFLSDPLPKRQSRRSKKNKKRTMATASAPGSNNAEQREKVLEAVLEKRRKPESVTVRWDNEDSDSFPGVPETEDISEAFGREGDVDEALLAFSSLDDVNFLAKINAFPSTEPVHVTSSLLWRHLLARWKHTEIWKAMTARSCTLKSRSPEDASHLSDIDSLSSASTSKFKFHEGTIDFSQFVERDSIYSEMHRMSGFNRQSLDGDVVTLTGYICDIGPISFEMSNGTTQESNYLRQTISTETPKNGTEKADETTSLMKLAEDSKSTLARIVDSIVKFSGQNAPLNPEIEQDPVFSTVSVKSSSSAKAKASRKYDDDVTRVLDFLRASIVFPDEGSLVCGLVRLWCLAKETTDNSYGRGEKGHPGIEILRLKNHFRTSPAGHAYLPPLPTGYRHILINIRLETGIIAGKSNEAQVIRSIPQLHILKYDPL